MGKKKKKSQKNQLGQGQRPTMAEYERRINDVYRLLLRGYSAREIKDFVTENTDWNVSERTIERYIHKAGVELGQRTEVVKDREFSRMLSRLDYLYTEALKAGQIGTARMILRDQANLIKLNTFEPSSSKQVSNEEILEHLAKKGLIAEN